MIKIISGWGNAGGSTVAFINLTNALNKSGIETVFYTPHSWHLDKCKADTMVNISLKEDDNLIVHFFNTNWACRPPIKGKVIYSCHEKDIAPIRNMNYKLFDKIHFVSRPQKEWHNVDHPSFILPNVIDSLEQSTCTDKKVAGIIGSIDRNKQTHISIQRALDDGMKYIRLFGKITDQQYFEENVRKYMSDDRVVPPMYMDNKQEMYNMVSDVYLSSKSETWSYLKPECDMTGVKFHGTEAIKDNFEQNMTNEEIVEAWKKELNI